MMHLGRDRQLDFHIQEVPLPFMLAAAPAPAPESVLERDAEEAQLLRRAPPD